MGKKINIGLLGLGNVGKGLVNLIESNGAKIERTIGVKLDIRKALVRDIRKHKKDGIAITENPEDIFNDRNIDTVVELTGQIEKGKEFIKRAIKSGKNVVTANKAVLARYGLELLKLAKRRKVKFGFEASVGGGIPIISAITEELIANRIQRMCGILNGTTNFILTLMHEKNKNYNEALKEAIERGFAEPDPTNDVEGHDARDKIAILSSLAFGTVFKIEEIPVFGIKNINEEDVEFALKTGYRIKLLAFSENSSEGFDIWIHPCLIPSRHILANIKDEFNAIFVKGDAIGDMVFIGKGAGPSATASAVLADIIEIAKEKNISLPGIKREPKDFRKNKEYRFYIRFPIDDRPGIIGEITTILGRSKISISYMLATLDRKEKGKGHVKLMVHKCKEEKIHHALEKIKRKKFIRGNIVVLKIADFLKN